MTADGGCPGGSRPLKVLLTEKKKDMKISVVVTAYNVGEWIGQCLVSILASSHKDLEVVVVEDCPTDNTREVVSSFVSDKRVRVIENEENLGAGMSRRIGIQNSTGDYIITIDGDDYISEDYLEVLAKKAEETGADIVGGGERCLTDESINEYTEKCYGNMELSGIELMKRTFGRAIVFLNTKIVNRRLYDKVTYCGRRFIEDTQTIAELFYWANKVIFVDHCGYTYRQRSSSLCHAADTFKNILFRALCAKDLLVFFNDKEEEYRKLFGVALFMEWANKLIASNSINQEQIVKYQKDWNEFTDFYFDIVRQISGKK